MLHGWVQVVQVVFVERLRKKDDLCEDKNKDVSFGDV